MTDHDRDRRAAPGAYGDEMASGPDGAPGGPNAGDTPLQTGPMGEPDAPDPQAGQVLDDQDAEPEAARMLHPDVGGPFGSS
jgi:hypothetical protein